MGRPKGSMVGNQYAVKHGMWKTSEWKAWWNAVSRCFCPTNKDYADYGGRGITMCDEWRNDFMAFYHYIGAKPSSTHSLDRINNDGNYEPGNVRWATKSEQMKNKRSFKWSHPMSPEQKDKYRQMTKKQFSDPNARQRHHDAMVAWHASRKAA